MVRRSLCPFHWHPTNPKLYSRSFRCPSNERATVDNCTSKTADQSRTGSLNTAWLLLVSLLLIAGAALAVWYFSRQNGPSAQAVVNSHTEKLEVNQPQDSDANQPVWPPSHKKPSTSSKITSRVLVESAFVSKTTGVASSWRPVINSLAWAPDCKELAAIGDLDAYGAAALGQFVVKFWDSTGSEKASIRLDLNPRSDSPKIAYSSTGNFIVAGSSGDWRIAKRDGLRFSPLVLHDMLGVKVSLSFVAFSPDDKELICVSDGHVMDAQGHVAPRVFLADFDANVLAGTITPKAELGWIQGTAKNAFFANAGKEVCLSGSFLMDRNYFEDGVAVFDRSTKKYLRFVGTPKNTSRDEYIDPESGLVFYWGGFRRIWAYSLLTDSLTWELSNKDGRLLGSNGLFLLFDSEGKVSAWDATGNAVFECETIRGLGRMPFSVRPDRKAMAVVSRTGDDSDKQHVASIHLVEFK